MDNTEKNRVALIHKLFPEGSPKLWTPPLTFYEEDGSIDFDRMTKHLDFLYPYINSYLIPGSTGDGWELNFEEFKLLLDYAFNKYNTDKKINIVIGILRTDIEDMFRLLDYAVKYLKDNGIALNCDDYEESRFKGFVICPPKGKDKNQDEIRDTFIRFLDLNYPTVLYQLPQVTENETSPDTMEFLIEEYANLYMMKDSSGDDIIARSERDYHKLILVRGAEGGYSDMLKKSGGYYDGFLLSTGNSFPKELKNMCDMIEDDKEHDADELSHRLTITINDVFDIAKDVKSGNAFTNSNKMIEHVRKFGDEWRDKPLPKIHSGENIPMELLEKTENILRKYKFY